MVHLNAEDRLRLQRAAESLCRLGARVLAELLAEISHYTNETDYIIELARRYGALSPEALRITSGNQFPRQLQLVPR